MSGGVENVTFVDSFSTGQSGIRISTELGRGGYVRNVRFKNIHFTQFAWPHELSSSGRSSSHSGRSDRPPLLHFSHALQRGAKVSSLANPDQASAPAPPALALSLARRLGSSTSTALEATAGVATKPHAPFLFHVVQVYTPDNPNKTLSQISNIAFVNITADGR
jgi:hypothetical protein